jgi:hypothetical protein
VQRAPPLLDGDWAVEEKGIKNHLARVAVGHADQVSWSDVIPPSNPPVWMAWGFHPEEIRGAGSECPGLRRGQAAVEQPLDHKVSSGVAPIRRKRQGQFLGRGEFREERRGLL